MTTRSHRMLGWLCAALLVAGPGTAQQITGSVRDGVYAEAQAQRGKDLMQRVCAECHEEDEFTDAFLDSWAGATVADLYDLLSSTMPDDDPGSLEPGDYADAIAYIFQLNGLPPGRQDLDTRTERLARILIEKAP